MGFLRIVGGRRNWEGGRPATIDKNHGAHDGDARGVDLDETAWSIDGNGVVDVDGNLRSVQSDAASSLQAVGPLDWLGAASFYVNGRISLILDPGVATDRQFVVLLQ